MIEVRKVQWGEKVWLHTTLAFSFSINRFMEIVTFILGNAAVFVISFIVLCKEKF